MLHMRYADSGEPYLPRLQLPEPNHRPASDHLLKRAGQPDSLRHRVPSTGKLTSCVFVGTVRQIMQPMEQEACTAGSHAGILCKPLMQQRRSERDAVRVSPLSARMYVLNRSQGCTKVGLMDRTTVLYLPNGTMPDANDPDMGQLRTQYQATPPVSAQMIPHSYLVHALSQASSHAQHTLHTLICLCVSRRCSWVRPSPDT